MTTTPTYNHTPAHRFPEFQNDGEWEVKRLGEIAELFAGATPSTTKPEYWEGGTIPWMSSGEVHNGQIIDTEKRITQLGYDNCSTKLVPANSVVVALAGQGKTRGTVAITRIQLCTNQSLCSILPNETYNSDYLYFYLGSRYETLRQISSGDGTRGGLNLQMLKDFPIPFPPLAEQRRIAESLSAIDEMISTTNKKYEQLKSYKKGLMQQLFISSMGGGKILIINNLKIPSLRFPEFANDKEWDEKKLGEIVMRITDRNKENNQNVLTISAQYGLVGQYDYFNKNIASADVSNYYLINKGDFAYNKSRSQGHPYGAIKSLRLYKKGVVSPLYICFRTKGKDYDCDFLEYYFDTDLIDEEIGKIAQEGARNHGLLNISTTEFFDNVTIFVPTLPEQRKIAICLSSIDENINAYTEKVVQLGQYKKGLMQQMFPQNQMN
jgi:type I restriction enzyme S subunit